MARVVSAKELREMAGEDLGVSRWLEVDQDLIDGFANVTDDHQFIHTDPKQRLRPHSGRPSRMVS